MVEYLVKVKKKANIRIRYHQITHPTLDTTRESDKNTRKHHTQEHEEVSPFQADHHKAARNRQDNTIKQKHETKMIHK